MDLSQYSDKRKRLPDYGLGRNCNLFDRLRRWAYRAIRQGWPDSERWHVAVLERARGYNTFDNVLSDNEVKAIARSVAKYTYKHFSEAGFSAVQAHRGRKGGIKSGEVRRQGSVAESQPWVAMGISRATYYRRKSAGEI